MSTPHAAPHNHLYRPAPAPRRSRLPLVGGTLEYVHDSLATIARLYRDHGPVSELSLLGRPRTVKMGHDACQIAPQNKDKAFANETGWGYHAGQFLDHSIMLLDYAEHQH